MSLLQEDPKGREEILSTLDDLTLEQDRINAFDIFGRALDGSDVSDVLTRLKLSAEGNDGSALRTLTILYNLAEDKGIELP